MPHVTAALSELTDALDPFRRLVEAFDAAKEASFRDHLSPLGNQRALDRTFDEVTSGGQPHYVVFGDLTGFKDVNDTHGHFAGDAVIAGVGVWLNKVSERTGAASFRRSGDEFILVVPEASLAATKKELEAESPPVLFNGKAIPVAASFGIARLDTDAKKATENAETACSIGKESGRRLVQWDGTQPRHAEQRWRCRECNSNMKVRCRPNATLNCSVCGTPKADTEPAQSMT